MRQLPTPSGCKCSRRSAAQGCLDLRYRIRQMKRLGTDRNGPGHMVPAEGIEPPTH